ncbi:Hermansky-Pudlak syndrome 1 protein isoform X2 [Amblyraja radiata]|uniref:Hermansky-Pudlak syndrome 1 protein isoform X2 n=1 Tax=Amblyraja radiata TaxID=386614 RepID=UPI0014033971|nr:Hermansky-Pudlak syndrome 1 protein isoform X2 [Amblyraja radiata]
MKCLLIASESAQVLFYWADQDFEARLRQQFEDLPEQHGETRVPAFEDSINTLFAPLLISCITLNEKISDTYTSFISENNYLFTVHQFGECTYIAVNGDGSENEDDLRRKIFVLKKIIDLRFGLVTLDAVILKKTLRPQDTEQRCKVWKMLQGLLVTYSHLREEDQSFLVEAVERLIHPQLCQQCIEFLDRYVVQQINGSLERANEEVVHTFILVHTKLLSFLSSRNASSLRPSDLLSLILIAQDMYPSDDNLEVQTDKDLEKSLETGEFNTPKLSAAAQEEGGSQGCNLHQVTQPAIKVPNSQVAVSLYHLLDAFTVIEARLSEGQELGHSSHTHPNMSDLKQKMDKFIKAIGVLKQQLQSAWVDFKSKAFSKVNAGNPPDLLQACRNVKSRLCLVYQHYFLLKPAGHSQHLTIDLQTKTQKNVQEKLMDWKDFLLVKSKRNTTMISYLQDFPGLIHFIYVDRTVGHMIAPSLSTSKKSTELGKGPLAAFLKNKVWSLVGMGQRYLQKGYTTLTFRDGDYYCCYFLWFENEVGYKLPVIELPVLSDDSAPIGMLTGDYYRKLLRYYGKNHSLEMIKCFELFTIHFGVIPVDFIVQQCCDLARRLWEPSRIPLF